MLIVSLSLLAWALVGTVVAVLFTDSASPRSAWVPMAVIFGPFWLPIAVDQRAGRLEDPRALEPLVEPTADDSET